jgi:mRNA interferase RelE/StbE
MKVEFLEKFNKDLDDIRVSFVKKAIERVILEAESANSIQEMRHVKKLSGFKFAYRIRIGDYRIGVYCENGIIQFARVANRKDIYRVFP